jgi:hypothetical protein
MPLYYRKRVRLGRRLWLNVSKSGLSVSARAGRVTANTRGRVTARLGGGLYWRRGR